MVATGAGAEGLLNKKVAFVINPFQEKVPGTWAQFVCLPASWPMMAVLDDATDYLSAGSVYVNPFTALSMYDIAKKKSVSTIIHNAGASALGKQLLRLTQKKGIELINVVRRPAQKEELHAMGSKYVIDTSKDGWEEEFKALSHELKATIIFDAIAGDIAGKFLSLMPNGSTLYNYGGLSGKPVGGFTGAEFIFQGKSVSGLWLGPYVMGLNPAE